MRLVESNETHCILQECLRIYSILQNNRRGRGGGGEAAKGQIKLSGCASYIAIADWLNPLSYYTAIASCRGKR